MNERVVDEFNLLLNNYWILKEDDPSIYYKIKKQLKILRDIANNKLGCDIICNNKLIKLEKLPIKVSNTYKIEEFDEQLDYVLFMCLLLFLEDKGLDEQFILSSFSEYVTNILAPINGPIKPDWNKYKDRKSMVDVMRYATNLGIIRLRDGNDARYADDRTVEALYENTTLSHYIVRNFKFDIFSCKTIDDFIFYEKEEMDALNKKRYMAYRGLIYYPNILLDEMEIEVSQYIKNMRGRISEDIERYLEGELIFSKNMAFISLEATTDKDLFPNYRRVISDIVLLVNSYLNSYELNDNDTLEMTKYDFKKLLIKVHEDNSKYFSKEFREMNINKFMDVIINYMESFDLLKDMDDTIIFNPVCYLINGKYPEIKEEIEETPNYDLFSMLEEEYDGAI